MDNKQGSVAGGVAKNKSLFSFGKGWAVLIFSMLIYYTISFLSNDGMNIYAPILASDSGFSLPMIYSMNSIAGWIAIPIAFINAWIMRKNNKVGIIIGILLAIAGCFWFGFVMQTWQLLLVLLLFQVAANGAILLGTSDMIANWFPTRKGTAIGWATIGASLNTAFNPTIWTIMILTFGAGVAGFAGLGGAFRTWGIVLIVLLLVFIFFIKCNPEDAGAWPDNDKSASIEEAKRARQMGVLYKKSSPWTIKRLFACKEMWIISIAGGIIMMITMGIMSNLIGIIMSYGFEMGGALKVMAITSCIGAVFSIIWGKVDATKGTKWATIVFYIIMAVALALLLIPSKVAMFIAIIFVACALGAGNNLAVSLTATVFGRYDFDKAWGVIYPIFSFVRVAGFAVVGILTALAGGSYKPAFIVLLICCFVAILIVSRLNDKMIGRNEVSEEDLAAFNIEQK